MTTILRITPGGGRADVPLVGGTLTAGVVRGGRSDHPLGWWTVNERPGSLLVVEVENVDERDSSWEVNDPRFRVYLFRPPHMATTTYDLTGTDVEGAIRWAADRAGADLLFSIALVHDASSREVGCERGLIWILGTDANLSRPSPREQAALDGMWQRHRTARSS